MIWAQGRDRAIGRDGTMAWHVPEDMAFFRGTTMGHPVIMGRKTWESLGATYQPLSGRENIVVTRDSSYTAEGAHVVSTLEAARDLGEVLAADAPGTLSWVMGGAQIYEAALPLADILAVTHIDVNVENPDAFAPRFGEPEWEFREAAPEAPDWNTDAKSGLCYRFTVYTRQGLGLPEGFTLFTGATPESSQQL
ncbi:MAG: dihydrofolate reductase [Ancrocorticia sp.]|uniref:dihydrofolate reductase n=1 Tax=Ancrocorticia sp. TaxID=2593684 RepID=UPI003F8F660B